MSFVEKDHAGWQAVALTPPSAEGGAASPGGASPGAVGTSGFTQTRGAYRRTQFLRYFVSKCSTLYIRCTAAVLLLYVLLIIPGRLSKDPIAEVEKFVEATVIFASCNTHTSIARATGRCMKDNARSVTSLGDVTSR